MSHVPLVEQSKRRRSTTWTAAGSVLAVLAMPSFAPPASAYSASGRILLAAPGGNGVTNTEFEFRCPEMPASQEVDGFVFDMGPSGAPTGTIVRVTGSDAHGLYDLSAYVYTASCDYARLESDPGKDLYVTVQAGDRYLSVFTSSGADVTVTFQSPATEPAGDQPNDPLFAQGQWNMRKVRASEAWAEATGAGIGVAVLDTGLDLGHPDFACPGKIAVVPGADPDPDASATPEDDDGHGTHVAGIVGACASNGIGVVGIAPDSTLMPIQVLSPTSTAGTVATAIETATDHGAHVITLSFDGGVAGAAGALPVIDDAIQYAVSTGVVVVAGAGDQALPLCGYPAIAGKVVCVGSTDSRDLKAWYGNFPVKEGSALVAPGGMGTPFCDLSSEDILSTYDRSADTAEGDCDGHPGYATLAGTSMAAALVAGAAALVYEVVGGVRSEGNAAMVTEALLNSAVDLYAPGYDPVSGSGRLDALGAVGYWPGPGSPMPDSGPDGRRRSFASATDPSAGTGPWQAGEITAGPLVSGTSGVVVTCTVKVGSTGGTHGGTGTVASARAAGTGATIVPTPVAYQWPSGAPIHLCTQAVVGETTFYWDAGGGWSRSSAAPCDPALTHQVAPVAETPGLRTPGSGGNGIWIVCAGASDWAACV